MLWESRRKGEGLGEGDDPSQIGMDLGMTRMELGVALIFYPSLQDSWATGESPAGSRMGYGESQREGAL